MRVPLLALLATALLAGPACAAANWADDTTADPDYDASRAMCRAAKAVPPGPAAPSGCSSEALLYGIGRPADPVAARRCAMAERQGDPDNEAAFAGTATLVTIFANGQGTPRDLDVATALACTLAGAPAEMDGRVRHLAAMKTDGPGSIPFSYCDDVTSGLGQGACAAHDSAIAGAEREAAFRALGATWSAADRAGFAAVRTAMEAFATARADNEIDASGTARAAFEIEAADAVRDDLRDIVAGLGKAGGKPLSAEGEDRALNAAYKAVMAVQSPNWGTPTLAGIRTTQRLWLAYRDALARFARGRGGDQQADAASAILTHRRTANLREFLN